MRLPEFDATNNQHTHLVELTQLAHNENRPDQKAALLAQIAEISNHIIEHWAPQD